MAKEKAKKDKLAKEKAKKDKLAKGDAVTVTGGAHAGNSGTVEHIRQTTVTAAVRFKDGTVDSVRLSDLAAA